MSPLRRFWLATYSAIRFIFLCLRRIRHRRDRLTLRIPVDGHGRYRPFRETVIVQNNTAEPTVLAIGFRLKIVGRNRLLHWLFQRVCIITTPFWSGLPGCGVKLWAIDPDTFEYAGIYQWYGESNTRQYLDFLIPILNFFSVRGSVWYQVYSGKTLKIFLPRRSIEKVTRCV